MKLGKRPLQKPRKIWNIDNTANQARKITHYITLDIQTGGIQKMIQFLVTNIGNEDIILGYPWMAAFEPQFTWKNGVIHEKELPIILRCYDHALLVTGYDVLLSTLQGNHSIFHFFPYHASSRPMPDRIASASLTIRPRHATLIGLMPRTPYVHCLMDSLVLCYQYSFSP